MHKQLTCLRRAVFGWKELISCLLSLKTYNISPEFYDLSFKNIWLGIEHVKKLVFELKIFDIEWLTNDLKRLAILA